MAYSFANFTLAMEYGQFYKHQFMASFIPFTIAPYNQDFWFVRPITGNKFSMGVRGWRQINLAQFVVVYTAAQKTCKNSFVDDITNKSWNWGTCTYDARFTSYYQDPYWFYDYLSLYPNQYPWYGTVYYYDKTFF